MTDFEMDRMQATQQILASALKGEIKIVPGGVGQANSLWLKERPVPQTEGVFMVWVAACLNSLHKQGKLENWLSKAEIDAISSGSFHCVPYHDRSGGDGYLYNIHLLRDGGIERAIGPGDMAFLSSSASLGDLLERKLREEGRLPSSNFATNQDRHSENENDIAGYAYLIAIGCGLLLIYTIFF